MNEGMLCKMNSLNIVIGRKMLVDRFGASQMIIMNYILHHREGVYQKDLENILNLRRATVSGVLKTMEKHNLIERVICEDDVRCKKIVLKSDAINMFEEKKKEFLKLEEVVKKGLSKEEIDEFNHIIDSMRNNLIAYLGKDSYDKIN